MPSVGLKPPDELNKPGNAQFYFKLLYDEPFGGVELQNITSRLQLLRLQYARLAAGVEPEELASRLRRFHTEFARACASGAIIPRRIAELVDDFARKRGRARAADSG